MGRTTPTGRNRVMRPGSAQRGASRLFIAACIVATGAIVLVTLYTMSGRERTESVQRGFRGTSMFMVYNPAVLKANASIHEIPEPEPVDPPDPQAPPISKIYKNVQVLTDLSALDFSRLMAAMTTWIAPEQGCKFCHNPKNLASDEKYTKVVARRMLQMTRNINNNWQTHVAGTGVTCWTCHRGQAVPSGDWFKQPTQRVAGLLGNRNGQNRPGVDTVGNAALPNDPLTRFLDEAAPIRIQGGRALAGENSNSIQLAEHTYGLMIYMSNSLGVNCSYCHNTRAFRSWAESSPQRSTAWYGIRMVRNLNEEYLTPIGPLLPSNRHSPEGAYPLVGCKTCHKGAFKPMYGVSMIQDYPELWKVDHTKGVPKTPYIPPPPTAEASLGKRASAD